MSQQTLDSHRGGGFRWGISPSRIETDDERDPRRGCKGVPVVGFASIPLRGRDTLVGLAEPWALGWLFAGPKGTNFSTHQARAVGRGDVRLACGEQKDKCKGTKIIGGVILRGWGALCRVATILHRLVRYRPPLQHNRVTSISPRVLTLSSHILLHARNGQRGTVVSGVWRLLVAS